MTTIHKKHDHICTHADTFDVSSLQNDDDDDIPARVKSQANFVREKNRTRTK